MGRVWTRKELEQLGNICLAHGVVIPALVFDPGKGAVLDLTEEVADASGSMNFLGMFTVADFPLLFSKADLMALIVFTIIFSIAVILAGEKGKPIVHAMDCMTEVIVNVIGIVMYLVVVLVYYVVSQTVMAYIGAGAKGVKAWWKGAATPTLTALGTCSSAASLPLNLMHAKEIGILDEIADISVPLGANLHKDGACIIQILKISLLCSAFGINYATPRNLIMSVVVAVVASVVMGGIPAGGYVAEIIISVFGFPTVSIPIMVLIGTITDAPATAINVTGDTGLAMIIARVVEGRDWMERSRAKKAGQEEAQPA